MQGPTRAAPALAILPSVVATFLSGRFGKVSDHGRSPDITSQSSGETTDSCRETVEVEEKNPENIQIVPNLNRLSLAEPSPGYHLRKQEFPDCAQVITSFNNIVLVGKRAHHRSPDKLDLKWSLRQLSPISSFT